MPLIDQSATYKGAQLFKSGGDKRNQLVCHLLQQAQRRQGRDLAGAEWEGTHLVVADAGHEFAQKIVQLAAFDVSVAFGFGAVFETTMTSNLFVNLPDASETANQLDS